MTCRMQTFEKMQSPWLSPESDKKMHLAVRGSTCTAIQLAHRFWKKPGWQVIWVTSEASRYIPEEDLYHRACVADLPTDEIDSRYEKTKFLRDNTDGMTMGALKQKGLLLDDAFRMSYEEFLKAIMLEYTPLRGETVKATKTKAIRYNDFGYKTLFIIDQAELLAKDELGHQAMQSFVTHQTRFETPEQLYGPRFQDMKRLRGRDAVAAMLYHSYKSSRENSARVLLISSVPEHAGSEGILWMLNLGIRDPMQRLSASDLDFQLVARTISSSVTFSQQRSTNAKILFNVPEIRSMHPLHRRALDKGLATDASLANYRRLTLLAFPKAQQRNGFPYEESERRAFYRKHAKSILGDLKFKKVPKKTDEYGDLMQFVIPLSTGWRLATENEFAQFKGIMIPKPSSFLMDQPNFSAVSFRKNMAIYAPKLHTLIQSILQKPATKHLVVTLGDGDACKIVASAFASYTAEFRVCLGYRKQAPGIALHTDDVRPGQMGVALFSSKPIRNTYAEENQGFKTIQWGDRLSLATERAIHEPNSPIRVVIADRPSVARRVRLADFGAIHLLDIPSSVNELEQVVDCVTDRCSTKYPTLGAAVDLYVYFTDEMENPQRKAMRKSFYSEATTNLHAALLHYATKDRKTEDRKTYQGNFVEEFRHGIDLIKPTEQGMPRLLWVDRSHIEKHGSQVQFQYSDGVLVASKLFGISRLDVSSDPLPPLTVEAGPPRKKPILPLPTHERVAKKPILPVPQKAPLQIAKKPAPSKPAPVPDFIDLRSPSPIRSEKPARKMKRILEEEDDINPFAEPYQTPKTPPRVRRRLRRLEETSPLVRRPQETPLLVRRPQDSSPLARRPQDSSPLPRQPQESSLPGGKNRFDRLAERTQATDIQKRWNELLHLAQQADARLRAQTKRDIVSFTAPEFIDLTSPKPKSSESEPSARVGPVSPYYDESSPARPKKEFIDLTSPVQVQDQEWEKRVLAAERMRQPQLVRAKVNREELDQLLAKEDRTFEDEQRIKALRQNLGQMPLLRNQVRANQRQILTDMQQLERPLTKKDAMRMQAAETYLRTHDAREFKFRKARIQQLQSKGSLTDREVEELQWLEHLQEILGYKGHLPDLQRRIDLYQSKQLRLETELKNAERALMPIEVDIKRLEEKQREGRLDEASNERLQQLSDEHAEQVLVVQKVEQNLNKAKTMLLRALEAKPELNESEQDLVDSLRAFRIEDLLERADSEGLTEAEEQELERLERLEQGDDDEEVPDTEEQEAVNFFRSKFREELEAARTREDEKLGANAIAQIGSSHDIWTSAIHSSADAAIRQTIERLAKIPRDMRTEGQQNELFEARKLLGMPQSPGSAVQNVLEPVPPAAALPTQTNMLQVRRKPKPAAIAE